jgi:type I restriction enzyme S subunit
MLTDNLSTIAAAPNGVKRLRELILQLAVRGRLVEQDSDEEPAGKILARIQKRRERHLKAGTLKKDKKFWDGLPSSPPFPLPSSWLWVRIQDVYEVSRGGSPRPAGDPQFFGGDIPWVTVAEITKDDGKFLDQTADGLTLEGTKRSRFIEPGDLLLTNSGATLGVPKISNIKGCINDGVALLRQFHDEDINDFAYLFLRSQTPYFRKVNQGMGQPNLNTSIIAGWFMPMPPLSEQRRIVTKVDELMLLCDQLDLHQLDAETVHGRLVQLLLSALTAGEPQEFSNAWERIADNFDVLFASNESIVLLKRTLIQLATMGRLGTHQAIDEPASSVISLIRERKAKLIRSGQLPKEKPVSPVSEVEIPYKVPSGWAWARIGDLSLRTDYGISEKTFEMNDGVPVLKMGDIQEGRVVLGGQKRTTEECVPKELFLKPNDLLYNRTNSAELVGKTGLFEGPADEYTFASYLIRIRVPDDLVLPSYLNLAMNAPNFRATQIIPHVKQQCGQANVNGTVMRNMLVPIPPTDEQRRIVARIGRLLAICDELGKFLRESSAFSETLSQVLIGKCFEARNGAEEVGMVHPGKDQDLGVLCI